jgi:hypothetical protein
MGATQNIETCNLIYDLHVDSPILQTEDKRQGKKTLFGGGLGKLDIEPIDIELKPGTKPYAGKYYNVPKAYK